MYSATSNVPTYELELHVRTVEGNAESLLNPLLLANEGIRFRPWLTNNIIEDIGFPSSLQPEVNSFHCAAAAAAALNY